MTSRLRSDMLVRATGLGMVLLSALLLSVLHRVPGGAHLQPTVAELCIALVAVCAGSSGAAMACIGRALFLPVPDPRRDRNRDGAGVTRD